MCFNEKAPLCCGQFSFQKCSRRQYILPCLTGKIFRRAFLPDPKNKLSYGRFPSDRKGKKRKCVLPRLEMNKRHSVTASLSFQTYGAPACILSCHAEKKRHFVPASFSFQRCSRRKYFLQYLPGNNTCVRRDVLLKRTNNQKAPLCFGGFPSRSARVGTIACHVLQEKCYGELSFHRCSCR